VANKGPARLGVLKLLTMPTRKMMETVSPMSIAPLGGRKLSAVKVAPATAIATPPGATSVVAVALLLAGLGSVCVARTVAVVLSVPLVVVAATMVREALAPLAKVPRFQVRMLLEIDSVPCVALVARTMILAGSDSLTVTPVAVLGPALVTATT